eukprot:362738-Chlamydomonas_euryale.AAC.1
METNTGEGHGTLHTRIRQEASYAHAHTGGGLICMRAHKRRPHTPARTREEASDACAHTREGLIRMRAHGRRPRTHARTQEKASYECVREGLVRMHPHMYA